MVGLFRKIISNNPPIQVLDISSCILLLQGYPEEGSEQAARAAVSPEAAGGGAAAAGARPDGDRDQAEAAGDTRAGGGTWHTCNM